LEAEHTQAIDITMNQRALVLITNKQQRKRLLLPQSRGLDITACRSGAWGLPQVLLSFLLSA
jgi:hypothetical protein